MSGARSLSCLGLLALIAASSCPTVAEAVIIDFNGTTVGDYQTAPYVEDGFTLTRETSTGHYDFFGPASCNLLSGVCTSNFLNVDDSSGFSSTGSYFEGGPSTIRLALTGGGTFSLLSLDVLDAYSFYRQGGSSTPACGNGLVSPFCIVQSSSGGQAVLTQGTMNFDGAPWTGITWIQFYTNGGVATSMLGATAAIDNINVVASTNGTPPPSVPEPTTLALLVFGLGGVALRRSGLARRPASLA